jgi:hypothetical protein
MQASEERAAEAEEADAAKVDADWHSCMIVHLKNAGHLNIGHSARARPFPHNRLPKNRTGAFVWAHPCHICTGTGPTPAPSASGQEAVFFLRPSHFVCCRSSAPLGLAGFIGRCTATATAERIDDVQRQ